MRRIESYVEDTPDMLRQFEHSNSQGSLPENAIPITVDVQSLYTSIPADGNTGGMQAFETALNTRDNQ